MAKGGKRPGAGRKKGTKNPETLEREAVLAVYRQKIMRSAEQLFHSQLSIARGVSYVYRIDRHGKGSSLRIEHVLLEDPQEIATALDIIANSDPNGDEEGNGFYYVTVKPPENRAIDSMLDRALGKVTQGVDHTTAGKELPTPILYVPSDNSTREN